MLTCAMWDVRLINDAIMRIFEKVLLIDIVLVYCLVNIECRSFYEFRS